MWLLFWRFYCTVEFSVTSMYPPHSGCLVSSSLLPLAEHILCQFAAGMSQSVTWRAICIYLSALHFYQIRASLPDPSLSSFPHLVYILKGIHKITPCVHCGYAFVVTCSSLSLLFPSLSVPNVVAIWRFYCT